MKWLWGLLACACSKPIATPPSTPGAAPASPPPTVQIATPLAPRGSLAVGAHHACALRANGHVACWGKGGPALGVPGSADELVAVDVPFVDHAAGVAAGDDLACAWTATGDAWCWGGEPGNRQVDHAPRRVPQLADLVQVVVGLDGACGLRATGRVACWKLDTWQDPLYPGPIEIAGIADAIEIAGDVGHLCARTRGGAVLCTAIANLRHPEIGTARVVPIAEAAGATSLAGYNEHFAAVLPGGKLASWDMAVIEDRVSPAPDRQVDVTSIDARAERVYAGGAINGPIEVCLVGAGFGSCRDVGNADRARALPSGVRDVALGQDVSCVRVGDRARCWGVLGRRGDGGAELPAEPVAVQGISDARQLEAGALDQTCVLRASGRVACWGGRSAFQPDGKAVIDRAPIELPGVDDAVEIAMSGDVVCARRRHGATCWTTDIQGGTLHAVDAPELASATRLFSGEEICGADTKGAVACTHFEPEALHPAHGAEELERALAAHKPTCVTTFNNGIECVHGAGNITLEHTDNYDEWCEVIAGKIMCHSTVTNPGVLAGFEKVTDAVSWDGRFALRADGRVTSLAALRGLALPDEPPVAKFHDVVELRVNARTLCARLQNGTVECWGPRDYVGAGQQTAPDADVEVSGLALGTAPPVVPTTVATPQVPAPSGAPIALHPIAMSGPFSTDADACAVQHCKRGEALDCQVDDDDPALVMASPPAPFASARLVSMDCRDPNYRRDARQTFRLLVKRDGAWWVSGSLFGAGGNEHYCGADVLPSWETRDIVGGGSPELVATVFTRTSCRGGNGGDDSDNRWLFAAGNSTTPYYFAPLATAAGGADGCSDDDRPCAATEHATALAPSFGADGALVLAGDAAAAKAHALAAAGTYRFAAPSGPRRR